MKMADYKAMYTKMFEASEQAINILIKAQRECEDMYISSSDEGGLPLEWASNGTNTEAGK